MATIKRIAAVGDIHVRNSDKGKWEPYFIALSEQADILLIAGDLTDTGDEDEAYILAEALHKCTIPVIAVLGNHDYEKGKHKMIRKILQDAKVNVLDGEAVVIQNIGFAGVKGFGGGFDRYMLSMFGESAMKAFVQETVDEVLKLDRALAALDKEQQEMPKIVLMHYAPVSETLKGEPEVIFPFLGSSRLAEPLARRNVAAAFHGHAHAGVLKGVIADVPVFNVALPILHQQGYNEGFYIFEIALPDVHG